MLDWGDRYAALAGASLLVNTTNQGMTGQPALDLRLDAPEKVAVERIFFRKFADIGFTHGT